MESPESIRSGVFVVIEGIDGAGTTTQAERWAAHLRAQRRLVHVTREPSKGPFGSLIRLGLTQRLTFPTTHQGEMMALLFAADRLDHVESEIAPHLRDGYVVISDRYDLSSLTYQSATSLGGDATLSWIRELNRHARRPDVTVVVDVSPEVAAQRRRIRGGAAELFDDEGLQARLAAAYRSAEALVPGDRVIHLDGDQSVDAVTAALIAALEPYVSPRAALR
jgi:dTMP kinase